MGHQKLNKLIVLFDNNRISIDGSIDSCSDDQEKRFQASNWNTITIDGHNFNEIDIALRKAKRSKKPTLISCKTLIGFGSPNRLVRPYHGSPLGKKESLVTKKTSTCQIKIFCSQTNF